MGRRLTQAALLLIVVFAVAQFVRPERANPATDPSRAIQAHVGTPRELVAILNRSCADCHSNDTVWSSWYTQLAPLSWLMAHEVAAGRKAMNFSDWAMYTPEQQRMLLIVSCDDAKSGKMPGPYPYFKPETRLSPKDVQTICAAASEGDLHAAGASR